jgi:hypothetical protein
MCARDIWLMILMHYDNNAVTVIRKYAQFFSLSDNKCELGNMIEFGNYYRMLPTTDRIITQYTQTKTEEDKYRIQKLR